MSMKTFVWDCATIWSIMWCATAKPWYVLTFWILVAMYCYGKRLNIEYQAGVRGDRKKCSGGSCSIEETDYIPSEGFGPDFINKTQGGE
jgi:hypothetical protein